jgi:hypothetical protein
MKLATLVVLVLGAQGIDRDPPVISLTLAGDPHGGEGSVSIIEAPHAVQSAAHFADECCGGHSCAGDGQCKLPVAKAFDHHDGDLTGGITTTFELFIAADPGTRPVQVRDTLSKAQFDMKLQPDASRGEFVLNYDVTDVSGNAAERITYALIMRDVVAPESVGETTFSKTLGDSTSFDPINL